MSKVKVANVNDIAEGDLVKVMVGDDPVALIKVDGKFWALSNICTHEQCELDENHSIDGEEIECTCHGSRFNIKTGENTLPPATESLKKYSVSVVGEDVFVEG